MLIAPWLCGANPQGQVVAQTQQGQRVQHSSSLSQTRKKMPLIYATFPTLKMGQMNLYDHHANVGLDGGDPGFTLSDVDALFSLAAITAATATNQR